MIWPESNSISKTDLQCQHASPGWLYIISVRNKKVKNRFPFREVYWHGKGGVKDARAIAVWYRIEIYFIQEKWLEIDFTGFSLDNNRRDSIGLPRGQDPGQSSWWPPCQAGGSVYSNCRQELTWNSIGNLYQVSPTTDTSLSSRNTETSLWETSERK